jgi:hypothetical protein
LILYHGTSVSRTNEIYKSGVLKAKEVMLTHGNHSIVPTEPGYLYLTNRLAIALYYARLANLMHHEDLALNEQGQGYRLNSLHVFKVDVLKEFLEPDLDEIAARQFRTVSSLTDTNYSLSDSLTLTCSARTTRDIDLRMNVVQHGFIECPSNKQVAQCGQLRRDISEPDFPASELEWFYIALD